MNRLCAGVLGFLLGVLVGISHVNAAECISTQQAYEQLNEDKPVFSKTTIVGLKLIDFKAFLSEKFEDELTAEMLASSQFELYYSKQVRNAIHVVTFKDGCAVSEGDIPLLWWVEFDETTKDRYIDRNI